MKLPCGADAIVEISKLRDYIVWTGIILLKKGNTSPKG
jgi:hypothetical protein